MKRKRFEKALMGVGVSRNEAKRITRKIIAHKCRADAGRFCLEDEEELQREFLAIVERASFRADQIHVRDREERVTDEA